MKGTWRAKMKSKLAMFMALLLVATSMNMSSLTVEAASKTKAKSVKLNHTTYTLQKGKTVKLKATVAPKNAKNKTIVWKSSKKSVATVSSKGVVKGLKKGNATITATVKGTKLKATCKIKVEIPVSKITVPKKTVTLQVGKTYTIKPTIKPKDASNKKVTYTSSKKAVATVSAKGKVTAKKAGTAKITVKAKDGSGKKAVVTVKVTPVLANKVAVKAAKTSITVGESTKVTATVSPSNTANKKVTWTSSNKAVAEVTADGTVKGKSAGTATITATTQDGSKKKASVKITVSPVKVTSVSVAVDKTVLIVGETARATATVLPANAGNKAVTWTSSAPDVATVDAKGVITAKKAGVVTITAQAKDGSKKKASVKITVNPIKVTSVSVAVDKTVLAVDETLRATATVLPANAGNKAVTWTSSAPDVATVDVKGVITAKKAGTARITAKAKDGSGKSGYVDISVENVAVESVSIEPNELTMEAGDSQQLEAKVLPANAANKKVIWSSKDVYVAIVDENGLVTAIQNGETVICATTEDGNKVAECPVTVGVPVTGITLSETEKTIPSERKFQLTANVSPENATTKTIIWTTSDEEIAEVSESGQVTTKKDGVVTITAATLNNRVQASCTVTVETVPTSLYLDASDKTININGQITLNATVVPEGAPNKNVIWSSSDENVATVENGVVTGVATGNAVITATTEAGNLTAICNITVGEIVEVSAFAELTEILAGELPAAIVLNTEESGTYEIPQADYPNTTLVVNAPNATVTNYAGFQKLEIRSISADTWIEKASGNIIDLIANEAHIIVDGEDVAIQVNSGVSKVNLETNGTVGNIMVATGAEIAISGTNLTEIPVDARAEGVVIKTSVPVAVEAAQNITLQMKPGAENSKVSIDNEGVELVVQGIGTIPVTNKETGNITDVIAENVEIEDDGEIEIVSGAITGLVYNAAGESLQDAVVYVIPYTSTFDQNDIEAAIEAAENQDRCYVTTTGLDGSYTTPEVPYGNYVLVVKADNLQTYFQTLIVNQTLVANETIVMMEQTEEVGHVEGILFDAFDASRVPAGIELYLRRGANNTTGEIVAQTMTNTQGQYRFEDLQPGTYTVQVVDAREGEQHYVRMSFNVVALANTTVQANMTITKTVEGDQIRFVLTWGEQSEDIPSDLDSHLIGPSEISGKKFHVYYSNENYYVDGVKYVDLDVDDTDWEGPETTTIYEPVDGLYHFYIYDYSNQHNSQNMELANSEGMVKVYIGDRNIATYHVPNAVGTLWDVCTYDIKTNTLTPVNVVYYHPGDSTNVGLAPVDLAKNQLAELINTYSCYDFGSALAETLEQKLQEANTLMETATDYEEVMEYCTNLENYFLNLIDSTTVYDVSSGDIRNYSISRQGQWYYDSETYEDYRLQGYSVLTIDGYESTFSAENCGISLSYENASYEWKDSDKEEFQKLLIVTNAETLAAEKYYVRYREIVPNMYPSSVYEDDNYIVDMYCDDTGYDEYAGVVYIYGENQTVSNPVFSFNEQRVQGVYAAMEDSDYAGTLTVTYRELQKVYLVKYIQQIREPQLKSVAAEGEVFAINDWYWEWDDETCEDYRMYCVSGTKEALDGSEQFAFQYVADSVTLTAVEGKAWDYQVQVEYKGITKSFFIEYTAQTFADFLPYYGWYEDEEGWYNDLVGIEFITTVEGKGAVRITGYDEEIDFSTLYFEEQNNGIYYYVVTEEDAHYIRIMQNGTEMGRLPLYYRYYMDSVSDGDGV